MKKIIFVLAFSFMAYVSFGQSRKEGKTKIMLTKTEAPMPSPTTNKQYVIILSETELVNLVTFIRNSDNYSDKGKQTFLDDLKKKIILLPETKDTTNKK